MKMDFEMKYPKLFEPLTIRGRYFRNRIFSAPSAFMDQDKEGMLPPEAALYYGRKAMGGAASVTVGGCFVDGKRGLGQGYAVRLDSNYSGASYSLHGLSRVAAEVSRYGSVCCAEMLHAGMYANRYLDPPGTAYGPVRRVCDDGRVIEEMPEKLILETIDKYAKGAAFLKRCGFGMVMVHAGHGWMLHQFLSPKLNTRTDRWGGAPIENRARFTIEVLKAVRQAVGPAFPIEVRISGSECYEGGYDIDEGIAFAKLLDGLADIIHVSAGSHEVDKVFTVTHPSLFLKDGCNVHFAAEIKKHVKQSLVATVGALTRPELMEEIIESGQADIVEIARGLMADPDLPMKARSGKEDEINHCLRCLNCFSNLVQTGHFRCAINPQFGQFNAREEAAKVRKKVLIAGGGIAGMEAAITCARRGHEVILCEKSGMLGGALRCEDTVPFKDKVRSYLTRQERRVYEGGVEVRLNTPVTKELIREIGPEAMILAIGGETIKPRIPGIDGANVYSPEEAYIDPEKTGDNVLIMGAGLVGMELAIYLAMLGKRPIIVEMLDHASDGGNFQHMKGVYVEMDRYAIPVNYETKALEIREGEVLCEGKDGQKIFKADSVVYAVGRRALQKEAAELSLCAPEVYTVGDCISPRNIMEATGMAYAASCQI